MKSAPMPLEYLADPRLSPFFDELQADPPCIAGTAAYQAEATDAVILCDATGGAFDVTLPLVAAAKWLELTVKRLNGGGNAVTLVTPGAETIDGGNSLALGAQYDAVTVKSDGSNWHVISRS
jgi:hypothetical protein